MNPSRPVKPINTTPDRPPAPAGAGRWAARLHGERGQALVEFTFVGMMMCVLMFGLIDASRALLVRQVMVNVSREGANLVSRGTLPADAVTAVTQSAAPLDITKFGLVIVTIVGHDSSGNLIATDQQIGGGLSGSQSRVAPQGVGGSVNLPVADLIPDGQSIAVAEVYYQYTPVTPVGNMVAGFMQGPTALYDVAYF